MQMLSRHSTLQPTVVLFVVNAVTGLVCSNGRTASWHMSVWLSLTQHQVGYSSVSKAGLRMESSTGR